MEDDWSTSYQIITTKHDEAYKTIERAIRNEEEENPEIALINYKFGISIIDDALATPVAIPDDPSVIDDTFKEASKMIQKMKRTRGEIVQRVATLSAKYPNFVSNPASPTPSSSNGAVGGEPIAKRPRTFTELAKELENLESNEASRNNSNDSLVKTELIFLCENTKLYHINPSGEVTTASESSVLRIVSLEKDDDHEKNIQTTFFLQIILKSQATPIAEVEAQKSSETSNGGESGTQSIEPSEVAEQICDSSWIYPLIPGVAPCFVTRYGAFIFPDVQSEVDGAAYGIIVPGESSDIFLQILEAILHGVVHEVYAQMEEDDSHRRIRRATSRRVSENIVKGAHYISQNLIRGSTKMGEFVSYGTPYVLSKLGKAPENVAPLSRGVLTGVEIAKSATGVAVNVTGYVASKVGSATSALGRFLAPHVQAQGSKLLSSTMGYDMDQASEKMEDVLTVTAGAVEGFGTVYSGLEESAAVLGRSISNNSVKIIQHKYGDSIGTAAAGTFDTVGNMINLSKNVGYMTPQGLVKKSAKNTGVALIDGYRPKPSGTTNYVMAGALCPDLSEFSKAVSKSQQI